MKRINLKTLSVLLVMILFIGVNQLNAQRGNQYGQGNGYGTGKGFGAGIQCNIPDLTEVQQKKIDELRLTHQKNMLEFRNQMAVKRAQLNTLTTADKADMNAINKTIDEIGALKTQMMKASENHRQQVRAELTASQKVQFDLRKGNGHRGGSRNCGMGQGGNRGPYNGQGWGRL